MFWIQTLRVYPCCNHLQTWNTWKYSLSFISKILYYSCFLISFLFFLFYPLAAGTVLRRDLVMGCAPAGPTPWKAQLTYCQWCHWARTSMNELTSWSICWGSVQMEVMCMAASCPSLMHFRCSPFWLPDCLSSHVSVYFFFGNFHIGSLCITLFWKDGARSRFLVKLFIFSY